MNFYTDFLQPCSYTLEFAEPDTSEPIPTNAIIVEEWTQIYR